MFNAFLLSGELNMSLFEGNNFVCNFLQHSQLKSSQHMLLLLIVAYCIAFVNTQCSGYTCVPTSTPELNCGSEPELRYKCSDIDRGECVNAWTECGACCVADRLFNDYGVYYGYTDPQQIFDTCQQGKCNTAGPTAQPTRDTSNPTATTLNPSSSPSANTDEP
eukprot:482593_1